MDIKNIETGMKTAMEANCSYDVRKTNSFAKLNGDEKLASITEITDKISELKMRTDEKIENLRDGIC